MRKVSKISCLATIAMLLFILMSCSSQGEGSDSEFNISSSSEEMQAPVSSSAGLSSSSLAVNSSSSVAVGSSSSVAVGSSSSVVASSSSNVSSSSVAQSSSSTTRTDAVREALTNDIPTSATRINTYGTTQTITYPSRRFGGTQTAVVVLPPNYNDGRLFPIMYFGHGITGSARANDMNSRTILGNLVASGEAKDMIIVYTNQWTPVTQAEVDAGNTMNSSNAYTPFINEWAENLHPYMLENFPVAPGRENVAITGFSMGGNMAIRIWMAHPDKIGFVGLGDPPAIVTSSTNIRNSAAGAVNAPRPWLILVTGAEPEGANSVGQGPQNISNALTQNGFDNVWHFVPGSGHNQTVMTPHLYNFLRGIF